MFQRFCFSISLGYNFSLGDLKYLPNCMTRKSYTSSSIQHYAYNKNNGIMFLNTLIGL